MVISRISGCVIFLGWDRSTCERNLQHLMNNTRFLIPDWVQTPHLVGHVLGLIARRITQGTRSLKGRESCERLWTVVRT